MADFNVSDVASRINPPQQMSIGDMLNIARGAQAYKQANEINPLLLQEAQQKVKQSTAEANVSEKTQESRISKSSSESEQQRIAAEKAGVDLNQLYEDLKSRAFGGLLANPAFNPKNPDKDGMKVGFDNAVELLKAYKVPTGEEYKDQVHKLIEENPQAIIQKINDRVNARQESAAQGTQLNAPYTAINNNQGTILTRTSPYQQGAPSQFVQSELAPTTEITISNEQQAAQYRQPIGSKVLLGPQSGTGAGSTAKPITSALPQSFNDKQAIVTEDFKNVQQQASGAQATVGILQDLKELAPKAATGAGADRKAFAIKAAAALGIKVDPQTMNEAAYTDLFNKESNMLSNMPGMTDAARAMSVMSNPNNKMDIRAIQKAADLLIARNKMILLEQGVKSKLQNQPDIYLDVKEKLDRIKDPRAIAFMSMPAEDKKNIWAGLAIDSNGKAAPKGSDGLTSEQREFKHKVDSLRTLDNQYNLGLTK
jgi:hypothetical protein